jgi:hypothetical protein
MKLARIAQSARNLMQQKLNAKIELTSFNACGPLVTGILKSSQLRDNVTLALNVNSQLGIEPHASNQETTTNA